MKKAICILMTLTVLLSMSVVPAFASGDPGDWEEITIRTEDTIRPSMDWRYTVMSLDGSESYPVQQAVYTGDTVTLSADGWDGESSVIVYRDSADDASGEPSFEFDFGALPSSEEPSGSMEFPAMEAAEPDSAIVEQFEKIELEPLTYVSEDGEEISDEFVCFVYVPEEAKTQAVPIVFALHGIGEVGTNGVNLTANRMATSWIDPAWQSEHPCIVVAPQCPEPIADQATDSIIPPVKDAYVARLKALFDEYIETYAPSRVYLTSVSMGSMTAFHFLSAYPDYPFDACLLCCGCALDGDVTNVSGQNILMVWDADDFAIRPAWTEETYGQLLDAGNETVSLVVSYMGYSHFVWEYVYDNPVFMEWLFAQSD